MYCYQCGTQLPSEANFCAKCGTKAVSSQSANPACEPAATPAATTQYTTRSEPIKVTSTSHCFASARSWALLALIPALFSSCQTLSRLGVAEFIVSVIAKFVMLSAIIFAIAYGICRARSK